MYQHVRDDQKHGLTITLFQSLLQIEKIMEGRPYFIETKLDGERVLLHKRADEYKYFSRRSANPKFFSDLCVCVCVCVCAHVTL